jgi:hypothetical protein
VAVAAGSQNIIDKYKQTFLEDAREIAAELETPAGTQ